MPTHLSEAELTAGLPHIQNSPTDNGILEMIVIRPRTNERIELQQSHLSHKLGVHGDNWSLKCWYKLPDGSPDPNAQITLNNSRCIAHLAQDKSRWSLAGDNLYVDLDLSESNLRPGQQLAIGTAILEITTHPHNGCKKFNERYGNHAVKFVNSPLDKKLHLRGIYAKVVQDGIVQVGDRITKIENKSETQPLHPALTPELVPALNETN